MKLEDQVCSLELANKLKELDIKQESLFYWIQLTYKEIYRVAMKSGFDEAYHKDDMASAFTMGELLKMIPQRVDIKKDEPFNSFMFHFDMRLIHDGEKITRTHAINYHCDTVQFESGSPFFAHTLFRPCIYDENPASALAKCLIYLIENGYVEKSECSHG